MSHAKLERARSRYKVVRLDPPSNDPPTAAAASHAARARSLLHALRRARHALRSLPVQGGWRDRSLVELAAGFAGLLATGPIVIELRDRVPFVGIEPLLEPADRGRGDDFATWADAGVGSITFTHRIATARSLERIVESLDSDAADATLSARRVWSLDIPGLRLDEPTGRGSSTRRRGLDRGLGWIPQVAVDAAIRANFEREAGSHPAVRSVRDVCSKSALAALSEDELTHCRGLLDAALARREVAVASGILAELERRVAPGTPHALAVRQTIQDRCNLGWWLELDPDNDPRAAAEVTRFVAQIGIEPTLADAILDHGRRSLIVALLRAAPTTPSTAAIRRVLRTTGSTTDAEYTESLRVVLAGRGDPIDAHDDHDRADRESC